MQPELPTSATKNEQLPVSGERPQGVETGAPSQERRVEQLTGQQERQAEAAARVSEMYQQSDPVSAQPTVIAAPVQPIDDGIPAAAADEDLIEKEWVDKIKQVIVETKDDPAERERAASRLQAEYLRKRYGKELGAA